MQKLRSRRSPWYYYLTAFMLILVYLLSVALSLVGNPVIPRARATGGTTYYVSKIGNNADGLSWGTAWNELDQIHWSEIQPGDSVVLDGGPSQMVYSTTLTVGKSGSAGLPITISRSRETGHNGAIKLFGGRSIPLPYCGQPNYSYQSQGVLSSGIVLGDNAYVIIDGSNWHGIGISGVNGSGIVFGANSHDDIIRNMEIDDDGTASQNSHGSWDPFGPNGVALHGSNHVFQYMDIHDNGEDAFQPTNINAITVQLSWLHDTRPLPSAPGAAFNQCNHNDGMQIWTGNPASNLTFDQDVIGPVKENGLILGNGLVAVSDVKVTNSLFIDEGANNIWGSPAKNWTIDHITSYAENQNLILDGSGHTVTNSIFYGGLVSLPKSSTNSANNCQWRTIGDTLNGRNVNPQFTSDPALQALPVNVSTDMRQSPTSDVLTTFDFSMQSTSPCNGLGSSITSVNRFLQIVSGGSPIPPPGTKPTTRATSSPPPASTQNPVVVITAGPSGNGNANGNVNGKEPEHGHPVSPLNTFVVIPWVILGVLLLVGATALFIVVYRKRKRT